MAWPSTAAEGPRNVSFKQYWMKKTKTINRNSRTRSACRAVPDVYLRDDTRVETFIFGESARRPLRNRKTSFVRLLPQTDCALASCTRHTYNVLELNWSWAVHARTSVARYGDPRYVCCYNVLFIRYDQTDGMTYATVSNVMGSANEIIRLDCPCKNRRIPK